MSNITVNRQGREAFYDNDPDGDYYAAYATAKREYNPKQNRIDWRATAVLVFGTLIALVVCFILFQVWKLIYCWSGVNWATCNTINTLEPYAPLTIALLVIISISLKVLVPVWTKARLDNAIANRTNLVLNRFGDQMPADLFDRLPTPELVAYLLAQYTTATEMESAIARYKIYRSVNSLNLSTAANGSQSYLEAADQDAETLAPLPIAQWLPFVSDRPHVLLAAATGEGKTVTAKALIAQRLQGGSLVMVIDPHSDAWFDLPIRGGGEDWTDVKAAIGEVYAEYRTRMQTRDRYLIETQKALGADHFQELTVLVDEAYLLRGELDHGSKRVTNYWDLLARVLSSGARKVNISVILISQTANVEDLGISGPLRRNFARIALDVGAIKEMIKQEEIDRDRKLMLYQSIIGMQYPATTVMQSQVELLDRAGLLDIANSVSSARASAWSASVRLEDVLASESEPLADRQTADSEERRALYLAVRAARVNGYTREAARSELGLVFDNDLWTLAGEGL